MHDSKNALASACYKVVHTTRYTYSEPVPLCHNELHLTPRNTRRQTCLAHELTISPTPDAIDESLDYFGNPGSFFIIHERHQVLSVTAASEVRVIASSSVEASSTPPWERVRDETGARLDDAAHEARQFVYDSPHVEVSRALRDLAAPSFVPGRPWLAAALDLTARIHRDFAYDPTATQVSTPLDAVLRLRRGVCQDFAHLQIGCLRSLGLAARYISGYLLTSGSPGQPRLIGADASHAWLSTFCPGLGWIELDPTNDLVPSLKHVTVAWGRDYSDVCPVKGVFVGGGQHGMSVSVDVRPSHEAETH
jgi:transglutaminase-like putative cysteine protease